MFADAARDPTGAAPLGPPHPRTGWWVRLRAERAFVLGFLALILLGALLLSLPAAQTGAFGFLDALFMATSAVCVTGLATVEPVRDLTPFGQWLLLGLFQLGALGIMTVSAFFFVLLGRRLALRDRRTITGVYSPRAGAGARRLVAGIVLCLVALEAAGALLLYAALPADAAPAGERGFFALFHAVSAACNAGFSLRPDSLTRFAGPGPVLAIFMALIVLGGLGFSVIFDLAARLRRHARGAPLRLHSRMVLWTSGVLIVAGAAIFLLLEAEATMASLSWPQRIEAALFQSITLRTAGFSTLDFGQMHPATLFLSTLFMFVGGSPGSAAGGIKTTTFLVAVLTLWASARGRDQVTVFRRTLPEPLCARALLVLFLSFLFLAAGIVALCLTETHDLQSTHGQNHFLPLVFEAVSAFGTVGTSTGITASLTAPGKGVIIVLMLVGRVGPLTVAAALGAGARRRAVEYPVEDVSIG